MARNRVPPPRKTIPLELIVELINNARVDDDSLFGLAGAISDHLPDFTQRVKFLKACGF